jgi:septum site-determining protein MinC
VTPKVTKYLDKNGICFMITEDCNLKLKSKSNNDSNSAIMPQSEAKITINSQPNDTVAKIEKVETLLLQRPVRSGEEIVHAGDVTIFGRVNSASKVLVEGNVEIYGAIDGLVQCDGEYMVVKELGKGHIIFNGDILEREDFDGNLKKVTITSEGVSIKDVF